MRNRWVFRSVKVWTGRQLQRVQRWRFRLEHRWPE